jgi:starch phosphorylase
MLDDTMKAVREGEFAVRHQPEIENTATAGARSFAERPADEKDIKRARGRGDSDALEHRILEKLKYSLGKDKAAATRRDWLVATTLAVRDMIVERWLETERETHRRNGKQVYYLSMEFLLGRLLRDAISNLGIDQAVSDALGRQGVDLDLIEILEPDAALGNGGLGRLAACFMESMASTGVPGCGYGIRYAHGLFRQEIVDGAQVEFPKKWLEHGNPWEFERSETSHEIGFGGRVVAVEGSAASSRFAWQPDERMLAVAHDTPVVGWRGRRVNSLRLWNAKPIEPILLSVFNSGDHVGALRPSNRAEAITRVLYPADSHPEGQELRLRQEYFFSSASLQDIVQRHLGSFASLQNLADKVSIQLNDTHPAVAIPELMRLLMDLHGHDWENAWTITRATFSYTNHTLLPEALEAWPVPLFERVLPRHLQIIYEINARVIAEAEHDHGFSGARTAAISLIDETNGRRVRMGHLAFVGSHAVNGVSELHTHLMKETVFRDLHTLYPARIRNKTNGITPRRWLMQSNAPLADLIESRIGPAFRDDTMRLRDLEPLAREPAFLEDFAAVKLDNKKRLAHEIARTTGVLVEPDGLFDVQVKRIHEYKRQLLNVLETVALYAQMRAHPGKDWTPRVKIFAGKAAAGYLEAKQIIRLINDVARVVNSDASIGDRLKLAFVPNYNVSLSEVIMPATDLSEQISTAGFEASGTGNMKLALNGALTIGTLDGANVEMLQHVGDENIFIFGLTAEEVAKRRRDGHFGEVAVESSPLLKAVLEEVASGAFSPEDPARYRDLVSGLYRDDRWMVAADFNAYWETQRRLDMLWTDRRAWNQKAVLNTARMGWFSSDRAIREYAADIWHIVPS